MNENRKRYFKEWREKHPNYNRSWYLTHPEYIKRKNIYLRSSEVLNRKKEYNRRYYQNHQTYFANYRKLNQYKNKIHKKAEEKINLADKCEICGSNKNLVRHHPDYSQPLTVKIVCKRCHIKIHKEAIPCPL